MVLYFTASSTFVNVAKNSVVGKRKQLHLVQNFAILASQPSKKATEAEWCTIKSNISYVNLHMDIKIKFQRIQRLMWIRKCDAAQLIKLKNEWMNFFQSRRQTKSHTDQWLIVPDSGSNRTRSVYRQVSKSTKAHLMKNTLCRNHW